MKYHSPDPAEIKRREQLHTKLQQTARTRRWMGYLALTTFIAGLLSLALGPHFGLPHEMTVLCWLANTFLSVSLLVQMTEIREWEREQLGEEPPDLSWMPKWQNYERRGLREVRKRPQRDRHD